MQNYRRLIAVFMTTIMLISIFSTTLASAAEVENTDTQAQTDVVEVAVDDEITDTAANTDVTTTAAGLAAAEGISHLKRKGKGLILPLQEWHAMIRDKD